MCWIVIFSVMRGINRKYTGSQEVRNSAQDYTPPLMAHKLLCLTNCWLTPPSQTPTHTCQYIWHAPPGKHMQFPTLTLNRTVWAVAGGEFTISLCILNNLQKYSYYAYVPYNGNENKPEPTLHCEPQAAEGSGHMGIWGYGGGNVKNVLKLT